MRQIKLTIEFPKEFEKVVELFGQTCKCVCDKLLDRPVGTQLVIPDSPMEEQAQTLPKPMVPKIVQAPSNKGENELPDDETFASLSLPEMIKIMTVIKNFTPFRFRAFAKCARQTYATLDSENNPVNKIVLDINPKGLNDIIKGKHKDQVKSFISKIVALTESKKAETDDIEF